MNFLHLPDNCRECDNEREREAGRQADRFFLGSLERLQNDNVARGRRRFEFEGAEFQFVQECHAW